MCECVCRYYVSVFVGMCRCVSLCVTVSVCRVWGIFLSV